MEADLFAGAPSLTPLLYAGLFYYDDVVAHVAHSTRRAMLLIRFNWSVQYQFHRSR